MGQTVAAVRHEQIVDLEYGLLEHLRVYQLTLNIHFAVALRRVLV